jgi:hypothetical protein
MTTFKHEELGLPEIMFGPWDVRYPDSDGMIVDEHIQRLVLSHDGTYTWSPCPEWARNGARWGVTRTPEDGLELWFETRDGTFVGNFLVPLMLDPEGPLYLNWQRTRADAVVFKDRIFRADRPPL